MRDQASLMRSRHPHMPLTTPDLARFAFGGASRRDVGFGLLAVVFAAERSDPRCCQRRSSQQPAINNKRFIFLMRSAKKKGTTAYRLQCVHAAMSPDPSGENFYFDGARLFVTPEDWLARGHQVARRFYSDNPGHNAFGVHSPIRILRGSRIQSTIGILRGTGSPARPVDKASSGIRFAVQPATKRNTHDG